MKKKYFLGIIVFILSISGCGNSTTESKDKQQVVNEPWVTIDTESIESDENGQFQVTGKAKHSSFSANIIQNQNGLTTQGTRGILKIEKDGTFVWRNIFIDGNQPTTDISFSSYKEKEKVNYQVKVDYSKFVDRQEKDNQAEKEINDMMPTILDEIVNSSENTIIKIDKKYNNYRSLVVTVPLEIKYERNGVKKKYMDTIGFLVQDKTASILYPNKNQIPYITFQYETTHKLLGTTSLTNRRNFILHDEADY